MILSSEKPFVAFKISEWVNDVFPNRITLTSSSDIHGDDEVEASNKYPGESLGGFTDRQMINIIIPQTREADTSAANTKTVPVFVGFLGENLLGLSFIEVLMKAGRRSKGSPRKDHLSKVAIWPVSGISPEMSGLFSTINGIPPIGAGKFPWKLLFPRWSILKFLIFPISDAPLSSRSQRHSPDPGVILSFPRFNRNVGIGLAPMFASSGGIGPESSLLARFSHNKLLQLPNSGGISPVRELFASISHRSEGVGREIERLKAREIPIFGRAFPISPVKLLPDIFATTKLSHLKGKASRASPRNRFNDTSRTSKLSSSLKWSSPSMMLCDRFKNLKLWHLPRSSGMTPPIVLLDRSR
nr:hypothetical protein TorRG33x02_022280 [Ipomoea trifida]